MAEIETETETAEPPGSPALVFLSRAVATVGGAGYFPVASGTFGTAVTVPFCWLLGHVSLPVYVGVVVLVTLAGIAAANVADRSWGTHDSGRIVIDESAGYLVTMLPAIRTDWVHLLVGFFVFRAFDIVKPPPVRWVDRKVGGGTGVVLDDVCAGVYGAAIMAVGHLALGWF